MPSIVTHHIFSKDVYESLPIKTKEQINVKEYTLFAQSFDNLFYYHYLTPWTGKEIRNLGHSAQNEKINLYFENIIDYITNHHLENNIDLKSYLYGSFCHYLLDSFCHPYIIYCTGISNVNKKYRGLHEKMEVNIDAYLYEKRNSTPLYKAKLADTLLPKFNFSEELKNCITYTFQKTFQKDNLGTIYEQSVRTGNFLLKYGVTDRTGCKKLLYMLKDSLPFQTGRKYQYLSFHVTKLNLEYLNEDHNFWWNPTDKTQISQDSFFELYEKAKEKAISCILETELYFKKEKTKEEVLRFIGDNSYVTGLPWELKKELKYFKN